MREDVCDLVVGPSPLSSLTDDEGGRINDTIFQPPEKCPLTNRKKAGYGCISESVPSGRVRKHAPTGSYHSGRSLAKHLVTKSNFDRINDTFRPDATITPNFWQTSRAGFKLRNSMLHWLSIVN